MSSKREQVLEGVKAMFIAALGSGADVARNRDAPQRVGPGGNVIIRDGDPGEPDVQLSPLSYTYAHRIVFELAAYESTLKTREEVLDDMLGAIGAAVAADRTLGGLCEWLEPEAPSPDDADPMGSAAIRWTSAGLIAVYSTPNPLT
ncbi:hypothetical protein [Phenylobacterium sp.]|uniref:hypothetical protein n=1 Tax=Phenylobacterium sp. TaxID=1871053 RepID=UPI0027375D79|nr:hypothetical protein [Phenylobacterium sp.]MDP3853154.1 hypothetical protein [Phenylobacterium sp.]